MLGIILKENIALHKRMSIAIAATCLIIKSWKKYKKKERNEIRIKKFAHANERPRNCVCVRLTWSLILQSTWVEIVNTHVCNAPIKTFLNPFHYLAIQKLQLNMGCLVCFPFCTLLFDNINAPCQIHIVR